MKPRYARFAYVIAFLMVASYSLYTLQGRRGVAALLGKQQQIQEMEKRNTRLAQEIERKREHIRRLEDNPAEQELEIRERLKLVHPNEKVYIIGDQERK
jgi:cell division protein FtsB